MKRVAFAVLGALALSAVFALATTATARESGKVLQFDTMTPVVSPFLLNENHPIRGVSGGGVAWALKRGEGRLNSDGRLKVEVEGLVIASTGVNPVSTFVAAVNCLTKQSPDIGVTLLTPVVNNVGANGNARFEATLKLPDPCVAPIVFVGIPSGSSLRWFATTGS